MTRGKWTKLLARLVQRTESMIAEVNAHVASPTPVRADGDVADVARSQALERRWEEHKKEFDIHIELGRTLGYVEAN